MRRTIFALVLAYLSGSILYANFFGALFGVRERYAESADRNPGTANAYTYGGFWCGTLTLIFDLMKGAVPVYITCRLEPGIQSWAMPLVLIAPVVGHILPVFHGFHGGKGIAVTFGVLLGLAPRLRPLFIFAAVFIILSAVVRIYPHYYRTLAAYLLAAVLMMTSGVEGWIWFGFLLATAAVCVRMLLSREEKKKPEVKLLWMR